MAADVDYSPQVLERFRHPAHAGELAAAEGETRSGQAGSRRAGTLVQFQLRIAEGRIADAAYRVFGSPHAIAACSLAAEQIIGRPAAPAAVPAGRVLAETLALPVERFGVALLVEDALLKALAD